MTAPHNPHAQPRVVLSSPDNVRVLDFTPSGVRIEHQLHLDPGAGCTVELPTDTGVVRHAGTVVQCHSLLGRDLPFWYESEIEIAA